MKRITFDTADQAAAAAAAMVREAINGGITTLGLATGGTMLPLYAHLRADGGPDMRALRCFNLDEYVGLPPDHPASYQHYMNEALFRHLNHPPREAHLPDGGAPDAQAEALRYRALVQSAGGIDLQLLGLGRNGHIAFNEPGSGRDTRTRVVTLAEETRAANARFFDRIEDVPQQAITMGVSTIMKARRCLLLVTGAAKADALAQLTDGPIEAAFPASFLREHKDVTLIADAEAAARLEAA